MTRHHPFLAVAFAVPFAVAALTTSVAHASKWTVTVHETTASLSQRLTTKPDETFGRAPAACATRQLTAELGGATASGTSFGREIVLTNSSSTTCSLRGYPVLSFTMAAGRLRPPQQAGAPYGYADFGTFTTVLAPGAAGSFAFGGPLDDAAGAPCPMSQAVRILAPGATRSLTLALAVPVCSSGIVQTAIGFGTNSAAPSAGRTVVKVDDGERYQTVTGVGAAMTDSSAYIIHDVLAPSTARRLMDDLYTPAGVGLRETLVPIGASDFTRTGTPYTYDDLPAGETDPGLVHFSIAHDVPYILPTLRLMRSVDPAEEVFAVPWTAPPWMKANDSFDDSDHGGALLGDDFRPFADYIARFVRDYAAAGVRVDAVAPENEPSSGAEFPAMNLAASAEAQFIPDDLVPALAAAGVDPTIYGSDSAWSAVSYGETLLDSPARGAIAGIASHCYTGTPSVMTTFHDMAPSLTEAVTECSPGISPWPVPELIIASMRNWASTVMVWNIALDSSGGPVQPPDSGCHGCSGLVTVDPATGTFTFDSTYYDFAQFGRFVAPGAVRIGSTSDVTYASTRFAASGDRASAGLDDVAFRNPDGSQVLLAYDNSPAPIQFTVSWRRRSFVDTLPAGATATFVWNAGGSQTGLYRGRSRRSSSVG